MLLRLGPPVHAGIAQRLHRQPGRQPAVDQIAASFVIACGAAHPQPIGQRS